ncbi:helix-turn-helix domain-containing protein [Phytoactinopolyspora limicola]|uniref:helix-turn-helix domain-containing protein n=1 Tax=Phytoactinopolyspora limicola TaxID=2715536 RepID=UPI001A9C43C9|nr:helix-turn-helix domain-containing protein [Phytoactinopolyspora limicola]
MSRTAATQLPVKPKRWRSSDLGVAEALLEGVRPTVSEVAKATGMSASTVTTALAFLTSEGLLVADAARGRKSARRLNDAGVLLDSYAGAVENFPPANEVHVGFLSKDPVRDLARIGKTWSRHDVAWAATSAVAATVLAPFGTQVAPLVVYVNADTQPQLASVADLADLSPIRGGRLTLRPFPTKATAKLRTWQDGLSIVPWARCYADLVTTGVRGEDIATNLREMKLNERWGTGAQP